MIAATSTPNARNRRALALAAALAGLLGACGRNEQATGSIMYPVDVRERHPIVLRDGVRKLDVFTTRNGLDRREADDVRAFAADYRSYGRGALVAEVPTGAGRDLASQTGLESIRRQLAQAGVNGHALHVATYRADDPTMAAPIRLSFARLKAEVPHECGEWPMDMGVFNGRNGLENRAYYNFGCAYQANLAAQIADPVDLVRPRVEGPADTVKRMNAIERIREGQDPSTEYRQQQTKINQSVGSN